MILATTQCASRSSLEWFINRANGEFEPSADGYGRFLTDEPGHLRRLTSTHLRMMFDEAGVDVHTSRFRAHVFTAIVVNEWSGACALSLTPCR
jgi:hypothetical protein